jgi:hypothetical protein
MRKGERGNYSSNGEVKGVVAISLHRRLKSRRRYVEEWGAIADFFSPQNFERNSGLLNKNPDYCFIRDGILHKTYQEKKEELDTLLHHINTEGANLSITSKNALLDYLYDLKYPHNYNPHREADYQRFF